MNNIPYDRSNKWNILKFLIFLNPKNKGIIKTMVAIKNIENKIGR